MSKKLGTIQRSAMLKASGCTASTSTDTLEVITNCVPIDLHLKLRQSQEVIRIAGKHDKDPLKEEFNEWMADEYAFKGCATTFPLLFSRFNELRGEICFEHIMKEFEYTRELFGLSRKIEAVHLKEFELSKDEQVDNIQDLLQTCSDGVLAFTDGSSIVNPGPTGAGAVIYMNGYNSEPVLLKRKVSKIGNNFKGEVVGIEIALEFLAETKGLKDENILMFTDCQAAITSAFCKDVPSTMVENTMNIKKHSQKLQEKNCKVNIHWTPGHRQITGNELADKQAKEAAKECLDDNDEGYATGEMLDTKEAVRQMKEKVREKWNNKFKLSEKVERVQDIYQEAGTRDLTGEENRFTFSIINQLVSGHTRLNIHRSRIDPDVSRLCETCEEEETIEHYIFNCPNYEDARKTLEMEIEEALHEDQLSCSHITLATMVGEVDNVSRDGRTRLLRAFEKFIVDSGRFGRK